MLTEIHVLNLEQQSWKPAGFIEQGEPWLSHQNHGEKIKVYSFNPDPDREELVVKSMQIEPNTEEDSNHYPVQHFEVEAILEPGDELYLLLQLGNDTERQLYRFTHRE